MTGERVFDAVIVGGGPRAVSVIERLTARLRETDREPLEVAVIDAVEIGAGATWRTDQTRWFLNNTTSAETTIYPDESTGLDSPLTDGPTLVEWAREVAERGHAVPWAAEEAREVTPGSFPSRRLQGVYYNDQLAAAEAAGRVRVTRVSGTVVDVVRDPAAPDVRVVSLSDGGVLRGRTAVLAQGMVQARPDASIRAYTEFAAQHGLTYISPGMPAEKPWAEVPAAEDVLVQGLGANFFDVVAELTAGRGGRFEAVADDPLGRLRYVPSGREPRLFAGSRRGVPYRSKGDFGERRKPPFVPRFATPDRFARLGESPAASLRFGRDVWPAIAADLAYAYLSALARRDPAAVPRGIGAAEAALAAAVAETSASPPPSASADLPPTEAAARATAAVDAVLAEHIARPEGHPEAFRIDHLHRPTGGKVVGPEEWERRVADLIELELDSIANPLTSPRQSVNLAMGGLRGKVSRLLSLGVIEGASAVSEVNGWFETDGLFLASGPPASRTREVLALIEAGIVTLIGPETRISCDEMSGLFEAHSRVSDVRLRSRTLVETRMSKGKVPETSDPTLRALLATGRGRVHARPAAGGALVETQSLEARPANAEEHPLALVAADGSADPGVLVLGIPALSTQPGSAIGATPGVPSPLLRGADVAAGVVLARASSASCNAGSPLSSGWNETAVIRPSREATPTT